MDYIRELRAIVGHRPLILVAAGVLLLDSQGRLLLQRRTDGGQWGIPGGCMELGETLEEAARREVREETGLQVGRMTLFGAFSGTELRYTCPNGDAVEAVSIVYKTDDFHGILNPDNNETLELGFFTIHELQTVTLTPANQPVIQRLLQEYHAHHSNSQP